MVSYAIAHIFFNYLKVGRERDRKIDTFNNIIIITFLLKNLDWRERQYIPGLSRNSISKYIFLHYF